jgi:DNA-binding IclR family transcriptional regulator
MNESKIEEIIAIGWFILASQLEPGVFKIAALVFGWSSVAAISYVALKQSNYL